MQPVRDMFAAIFFVSVGMLIDPAAIAAHWPIVLAFLAIVVVGNVFAVTLGAFLTGQSVQTSVKTGMSLAQIGEFSFIIAGVGVAMATEANEPTYKLLYSIAVAVSGITTLLTPWLIRAAEPTAALVDRKLPRSLQTFVALYGTWLEKLRRQLGRRAHQPHPAARSAGWSSTRSCVAAIIIGASLRAGHDQRLGPAAVSTLAEPVDGVRRGRGGASSPRRSGSAWCACRACWASSWRAACFPTRKSEQIDLAAAPRRLLVVTLQLAIVLLVGVPLVAITQPFVPPLRGAAVLLFLLALLAFAFWRNADQSAGTHARRRPGDRRSDRPPDAQGPGHGSQPTRSPTEARRREPHHHRPRLAGADRARRRQPGRRQDARRGQAPRSHRRHGAGHRARRRIGRRALGQRTAAGRATCWPWPARTRPSKRPGNCWRLDDIE